MASVDQLLLCLLLLFGFFPQTLSCYGRDEPLLLSSYLERNEIEKARSLSKVEKDCLEDFVPDSYTGFLTVDKQLGNHMFFWFFPASDGRKDPPLLLWLNGGPTVSSMLGLFWEHGPMAVVRNETIHTGCKESPEKSESGYTRRKYSWTEPFSMLYVDNPVGVGFSFSDSGAKGHRFSEYGYTKDMVSFMKQFLQLFPEYADREIYIGGQSYAGRYVSAVAYEFHREIMWGRADFIFTGIYLGAPWYDAEIQNKVFYNYFYTMGGISYKTLQDSIEQNKEFYTRVQNNEDLSEDDIKDFMATFYDIHDTVDNYVTSEVAGYKEIAALLSKPKMMRAAHVGDRKFVGADDNEKLFEKFLRDTFLYSSKTKMAELLSHYKVLIYNGNYDDAVSTPMIEAALAATPWKLQKEYNASRRTTWLRHGEVVGYYSQTGSFCRVVVHGAGHQVPHDKPEVAFAMMTQFVADGCVKST